MLRKLGPYIAAWQDDKPTKSTVAVYTEVVDDIVRRLHNWREKKLHPRQPERLPRNPPGKQIVYRF